MNREKILFLVVLGLALLWGGTALTGPYRAKPYPSPGETTSEVPDVAPRAGASDTAWLLTLITGRPSLPAAHSGSGRTIFVPHSDLLPVEPAVLDLPRALPTPWVLPPVREFPDAAFFRWFRTDAIPPVTSAPPEESAPTEEPGEEKTEPEGPDEGKVLASRQKQFVPTEWDKLILTPQGEWYGKVSLKDEQKKKGLTKYDLLLPENAEVPFYWEQINQKKLTVESSGMMTLANSPAEKIVFADTIENEYWTRRTTERVKKGDAEALVALGKWVMQLAEEPKYDRMEGLELAAKTFQEAKDAAPDDPAAVLALGEAWHRQFKFDAELGLYEKALAAKVLPEYCVAQARLFRSLALPGEAEKSLTRALTISQGDVGARLMRASVRYEAGEYEGALADYSEAEKVGSPEEKVRAREGRARTLLATGKPAEAAALLTEAEDAPSLVTLGSALYAEKKWQESEDAFTKALAADDGSVGARTGLGFAQAMCAKDDAGIQKAIESLEKARAMDPLNYFWPPLGEGFAEQRRGRLVESADRYTTASLALPGNAYVHYVLGRTYLRDGRFEDARNEFLIALQHDYRFVDALFGAGSASVEHGDFARARNELARVVEVESRSLKDAKLPERRKLAQASLNRARYRLGRTWLVADDQPLLARVGPAEEQFRAILSEDETSVPALNALGYILYQQGAADDALNTFNRVISLTPATGESPDRDYAKEMRSRILDSLSRRRWVGSFDAPDGTPMDKNGKWLSPSFGSLAFRMQGGKAVLRGQAPKDGSVWLVMGDPSTLGARDNNLGRKFIRARATISSGPGLVSVTFMMYKPVGSGNSARQGPTIGVGRSTRGKLVIVRKDSSEKAQTETVVKDAAGNEVDWPTGDVQLEILRTDHAKGVFRLVVNGEAVGDVDLSTVSSLNNRSGQMDFAVLVQFLRGENLDVAVSDVGMELYTED